MVSFDTTLWSTLPSAPLSKTTRARDLVVRGMRTEGNILLLETLAEFSNVAIRKAGIAIDDIRTRCVESCAARARNRERRPFGGPRSGEKTPVRVLGCDAVGRGTTGRRSLSAHRGPAGMALN